MKKYILLFLLSFCLNNFVNAQGWRKAYDTPISGIQAGYMADGNTIWLVGDNESIFKSTDGGFTWVEKFHTDNIDSYAHDISFVNSTTAFVGCDYGRILKTTDGGETWNVQLVPLPDSTYDVIQVHFFDSNLGFALCDSQSKAFIYKTTNGGIKWDTTAIITGAPMYAMDFYSPTNGIVTGNNGNNWYTTNGSTWSRGSITYESGITYSRTDQWGVKFISATTAFSCGWGTSSFGLQPTIILKTTDGGATWNQMVQADENKTYVNFKSLYFKDQSNGITIGSGNYPGTVICRTSDGGINWIPLPSVAGFTPQKVIGFNDHLIVAGDEGSILVSSDFGNSWIIGNKHTTTSLLAINISNNNIYACGYSGSFYKSTDMGTSFNLSYMVAGNKCLRSLGLQFLTDNLGYAASQKGQALKTTDAGTTWIQVLRDTNSNSISNQGVYFINENIGFVVGNYNSNVDIIYKTTDGGSTWSHVVNNAFQTLNCISFADDAMHGAAGGNHSTILYTSDQGVSWNVSVVNTTDQLSIKSIKFYDGLNGIAVGEKIILKTSDGGATWNRIALPTYAQNSTFTSVYYKGSTFYVAGDKYCLKSTDVGNSWLNIMDTVFAAQNWSSFSGISMDNSGYLWIACGSGIITNSPAITGINKDVSDPISFKLEQNYPNPFNPSTSINFSINKHGYITLKLFDVLGRLVREIYKGEMSAGQHNINFNAGSLASGTYIYTLQMNDHFVCRKMMLLK